MNLTVASTLRYLGERYQYVAYTEDWDVVPGKISSEWHWRAVVNVRDIICDNVDLQVGVNNILDEDVWEPYTTSDGLGAVPGMGREYFASLSANW